jgi:hypothetical protein
MPFRADGCALIVNSPYGKLMELSFPMAYLMAQITDGILAEASFNLADEDAGTNERITVRIRIERI